ncbi:CPCC family cysteine-rich protein [Bacillus salitolerans]|uniref:CPCC family cysteine-rich protein n=1 Tax=Bacillus salitolerans TaxID=1437434 RepID=A0ABW4LX83_9BACI
MKHTCPCCGFKTLDNPFEYDICEICDWEDDPTQLDYPALELGPNNGSLCEEQWKLLKNIPEEIKVFKGFQRDSEWRPLLYNECINPPKQHKTGLDYFNLIGEEQFEYYWKQ